MDGVIYARKKAAAAATPAKVSEPDRAPAPLKAGVEEGVTAEVPLELFVSKMLL